MTTNPIWVPAEEIEREVAGQTVPKQFLEIVGNHPDLVLLRSMQGETPDAWNEWTAAEYARSDRSRRSRSAPPWAPSRSATVALHAQPPGLPLVRRRGAVPPGDPGEHLQLLVARRDPVSGRPRRSRDRRGGGQRVPGADPQSARRAPTAPADLRHPSARRGAARRRLSGVRPARPRPAGPRRAGCRHRARRSGHAHLHLRDHRPAKGRHDQPGQRGVHGGAAPSLLRHGPPGIPGQAPDLLPPDGPHRRAHHQPLPGHGRWPAGHLLPRPDPDRDVRPGGAPRDDVRRAAGVGEGLPRRQRRSRGRPGEAAEVRGRPGGRAGDQGGRAGRFGHAGTEGHVGLPGRGRLLPGARPAGPGRPARGHHRCGAHPPPHPGVVQRHRGAAERDLRDVGVLRPDDLGCMARSGRGRSAAPSRAAR